MSEVMNVGVMNVGQSFFVIQNVSYPSKCNLKDQRIKADHRFLSIMVA